MHLSMRVNLVIDEKLAKEAFKYSQVKTWEDLIEAALREFIENHRRMDLRELRGKISFRTSYDYKALR